MTGSEKQIKLAEDLKARVLECIESVINNNLNHPLYAQYKEQADAVVATWLGWKANLESCNSAPAIIDFFGFFKSEGDIKKDAATVAAIYTTTLNNGYKFK